MNYPDEYMSLFHRLTVVASTWVSPQDAEDVVQDVLVGILEKQDLRLQTLFCCAEGIRFHGGEEQMHGLAPYETAHARAV